MSGAGDVAIRPAGPPDAEQVVRVYVDSWNAGFGSRMPSIEATPGRTDRWRAELAEAEPVRWWVAERRGAIVGFAGIRPSRDPVDPVLGELDSIAVAPPAWRSGVGRALMAVALVRLRADGYRAALVWTLSDYPRGASFYQATGWRPHGATRDEGRQVRWDHGLAVPPG